MTWINVKDRLPDDDGNYIFLSRAKWKEMSEWHEGYGDAFDEDGERWRDYSDADEDGTANVYDHVEYWLEKPSYPSLETEEEAEIRLKAALRNKHGIS